MLHPRAEIVIVFVMLRRTGCGRQMCVANLAIAKHEHDLGRWARPSAMINVGGEGSATSACPMHHREGAEADRIAQRLGFTDTAAPSQRREVTDRRTGLP